MDKYLLTLLVTYEQEYAIQKLFGRHGWEYSKMDKPKEDFSSTNNKNETNSETEKDLTGNAVRKKSVTGETSQNTAAETVTANKVLSNPEKNSHLKGLSTNTIRKDTRKNPVVVMDRVFDDVKKMNDSGNVGKIDDTGNVGDSGNVGDLVNVGKIESGEEENVEDYGGDTDTEDSHLDELGITVKIEAHSDVDDHLVEEAASSPPVKRTGRGRIVQTALKRPAAAKTSIVKRSKRRRTAGEDTNVTNKVNVDIKVEDVETEDPLQFLETLPDVKLFIESVNSEIDDIETFLSGPDDVDESGYSARFSAYFCKDCHYTFPEETYYSVHKREGKCVFPCAYCNEKFTFRNYSKFREHQKQHTKRFVTMGELETMLDNYVKKTDFEKFCGEYDALSSASAATTTKAEEQQEPSLNEQQLESVIAVQKTPFEAVEAAMIHLFTEAEIVNHSASGKRPNRSTPAKPKFDRM